MVMALEIGPNFTQVLMKNLELIERHGNADTITELMALHTDLIKFMLELIKEKNGEG
jgi:hypothetical protein